MLAIGFSVLLKFIKAQLAQCLPRGARVEFESKPAKRFALSKRSNAVGGIDK